MLTYLIYTILLDVPVIFSLYLQKIESLLLCGSQFNENWPTVEQVMQNKQIYKSPTSQIES